MLSLEFEARKLYLKKNDPKKHGLSSASNPQYPAAALRARGRFVIDPRCFSSVELYTRECYNHLVIESQVPMESVRVWED